MSDTNALKKFLEQFKGAPPQNAKFHYSDSKGHLSTDSIRFRYEGLCDFNGMYAALIDYSKHHGYIWQEKTYKHKVPSPKGAEQEFVWLIQKDVNEIIKYEVEIETHIWDMRDIVVDIEGGKQRFTQLRLEIVFKPKIIFDRHKYFNSKNGLLGMLSKLYWKSMSWQYLITYYDDLYYDILKLQNTMKQFCDMKSNKRAY